jgi:hypothetical protein
MRMMSGEDTSPNVPARFLKFLKWLSITTGSVVAYYTAFSWGGPYEVEFSYVFEPEERVYCGIFAEPRIRIYREQRSVTEEEGDVLVMTLWRLGVDSPRGAFPPHEARFDWSRYNYTCPDESRNQP